MNDADCLLFKAVVHDRVKFNQRMRDVYKERCYVIRKEDVEHHLSSLKGRLTEVDFKRLKRAVKLKFGGAEVRHHAIVLTRTRITNYIKRGFLMYCCRCKQWFKLNDRIISRCNSSSGNRKFYHKTCWESMFLE